MNLVIDVGNTKTKFGIFNNQELINKGQIDGWSRKKWEGVLQKGIESVIISSVKDVPTEFYDALSAVRVIRFDSKTAVPIHNKYETPDTLGLDRLAAVVGGSQLYPDKNILIIDSGTAVTYDFVDEHHFYLGGGISPGVTMRFKALNTFTSKLPLVTRQEDQALIGNSTEASIRSGVQNGLLAEMVGVIDMYKKQFPGLVVLMTGGDAHFFDSQIKSDIFVLPNLVLTGLNETLRFNS